MCSFETLKWCWTESNRRHKDFQSFALPTELQHPFVFGGANINNLSFTQNKTAKKINLYQNLCF